MDRQKPRVLQLDFLRGVAILLVLLRHPIVDPHDAGKLLPLAGLVHHLGWTGVDLFFVLSGFLVGGLLFDEIRKKSQLDVRRFIIRRGFKIWPPYFVYLFGVYFILLFRDPAHDLVAALSALLPNLLHLQNYLGSVRAHTWSLAVEEHMYLALPFIVMLCLPPEAERSKGIPRLPFVGLAVMVACLSIRVLVNLPRPFTETTHYFATHVRVDSLFFGVLLAYFYHYGFISLERVARRRSLLLGVGAVLLSPMAVLGLRQPFVWTVGYTFLYLGYGAILLSILSTPLDDRGLVGRLLSSKFARLMAWVGYFSYSIYLWHLDIGPLLASWVLSHALPPGSAPEARYLVGVVLYLPLAVVVGVGMAKLIEGPSLKLRDRLFPSRSQGITMNSEGAPARVEAQP